MNGLSRPDLEGALEFVHAASSANGHEPFSRPILESLARLVPCESLGYYEWNLEARRRPTRAVEAPAVTTPPAVADAIYDYCSTYPLSNLRLAKATRPCRLSDFVPLRALHRLDYYDSVLRPLGIEHQLRLFLPAPEGRSRVFYFNRGRGDDDFGDRKLELLELLRPFLAAMLERFELRRSSIQIGAGDLTDREAEILEWVALGKTNQEIAALLVVSPHTVRKHLENVYAKLGVHTRTAAVARASAGLN